LQSESVYNRGSDDAVIANLRANGATESEIDFLLEDRVELNAMTSPETLFYADGDLCRLSAAPRAPRSRRDGLDISKISPDRLWMIDLGSLRKKRAVSVPTH